MMVQLQRMEAIATSRFQTMASEISALQDANRASAADMSALKVDMQQQIDGLAHTNRVLVRSASAAWRVSVANAAIDDIFKMHNCCSPSRECQARRRRSTPVS